MGQEAKRPKVSESICAWTFSTHFSCVTHIARPWLFVWIGFTYAQGLVQGVDRIHGSVVSYSYIGILSVFDCRRRRLRIGVILNSTELMAYSDFL